MNAGDASNRSGVSQQIVLPRRQLLVGGGMLLAWSLTPNASAADAQAAAPSRESPRLEARPLEAGGLAIHRVGQDWPLLVQNAPPDARPWLHPLTAPDGKGILTEESPSHHKHQTGIFFGFTRVNGRDYYHNRTREYYRRKDLKAAAVVGGQASWATVYDLLGANGAVVLVETQEWTIADHGDHFVLDLDWNGKAAVDLTMARFDYGGLFVRMPWRREQGGKAVNSEGQEGGAAEGKRARWVDVGMPLEGRTDWAHIAVLDHPENSPEPVLWRVDGSLGVCPARSRAGEWPLGQGQTARLRYRMLAYTGPVSVAKVESEWKRFAASK